MPMLLKITLSILVLTLVNLLLLKISCNKIDKTKKQFKEPVKFRPEITISREPETLAPTGS